MREISDELYQLRQFIDVEPGNQLLIDLLLMERAQLMSQYIRVV